MRAFLSKRPVYWVASKIVDWGLQPKFSAAYPTLPWLGYLDWASEISQFAREAACLSVQQLDFLTPRTAWFVANLLIVASLVGIRFGPELKTTCIQVIAKLMPSRVNPNKASGNVDGEYEERKKLAADWAKRAKNRRPFT